MNTSLREKVMNPALFSSMRYMLHALETGEMYRRITEILPVSPYLAVWAYVTAESNDNEEIRLLDQLETCQGIIGETVVQKALAYDLLGKHNQCRDTLYAFFGRVRGRGSYVKSPEISDFWWNKIGEVILSEEYVSIWPVYLRHYLFEYGDLGFAEKEKIVKILGSLYESGDYGRLLQATEQTGLYGELLSLVGDFTSFFMKVLDLYIAGKLQYAIDYREECNAVQKLTTIYLLKGYDPEAILIKTQNSKLKNKLHMGKDTLYWFVHNWKYNSYDAHNRLPLSKDNIRKWSSELNATPYPIKALHGRGSSVWWEDVCGHIWQRSIKSMERDGSCPYCGGR